MKKSIFTIGAGLALLTLCLPVMAQTNRPYSYPAGKDAKSLWDVPDLLLQKAPSDVFAVTTKLRFSPSPNYKDERTGLVVMGLDYAGLVPEHTDKGVTLSQIACAKADADFFRFTLPESDVAKQLGYAIRIADSEMARCPESWQLDFQPTLKWDYCHGLELQSFLDLYERTGYEKYLDYAWAYADTMIREDGSITAYTLSDYNIDRVNSGKMLFRLYDYTRSPKVKRAIDLLRSQLETQPRNDDGGFWHKQIYPHQVWLDGVYMGTPFMAEYAARFGRHQDFADVINQIRMAAKHTYDPATGLYRHACDVSKEMFWADKVTGQSKHVWGRAMGWYAMAIVDALDFVPTDQEGRDEVLAIFTNIAVQLKRIQDSRTGLWYQVLDRSGDPGNYLESSGSSMFIYALSKAIRMGYIDISYRAVVEKAWQGFLREFVETGADGLMNITKACAVAGLGGADNRSGDYDYYINEQIRANDPKVIGPFIMAVLERSLVGLE